MLSFSQPLFLKEPRAFWLYFPTSAEPGMWKNLPQKHLKPIWRHVANKTCLETVWIPKKHKKRLQLRSDWAPGPPTNFSYFSICAAKWVQWSPEGAKRYQNDTTNAFKVSASGFKAPKIELNVPNGGLSSKVYIYIYIYICVYMYVIVFVFFFL